MVHMVYRENASKVLQKFFPPNGHDPVPTPLQGPHEPHERPRASPPARCRMGSASLVSWSLKIYRDLE